MKFDKILLQFLCYKTKKNHLQFTFKYLSWSHKNSWLFMFINEQAIYILNIITKYYNLYINISFTTADIIYALLSSL
jgi:hypothetical protein